MRSREMKKMRMMELLDRFGGEKIFVVQGGASLLLLVVTVIVCFINAHVPEESGVLSAAICIAVAVFAYLISTLSKEGAEGVFFAIIGSFISGLAATLIGSRLAFDPDIKSYFLASIALSLILSFSCILYAMPENISLKYRVKAKEILVWLCSTIMAVLVNFAIIYWLPKIF